MPACRVRKVDRRVPHAMERMPKAAGVPRDDPRRQERVEEIGRQRAGGMKRQRPGRHKARDREQAGCGTELAPAQRPARRRPFLSHCLRCCLHDRFPNRLSTGPLNAALQKPGGRSPATPNARSSARPARAIVPSSNSRPISVTPCGTRRGGENFGSGCAGSGAQSLRASTPRRSRRAASATDGR